LNILLLFVEICALLSKTKVTAGIFNKKWLDRLLLMMSYVVTIAIDSHQA